MYLAFPEGEARERVLFDLVKQFSKMDPEYLEWLRYKLSVVGCHALDNMARGLEHAAPEQSRLHGVTRGIADYAATQMKGTTEDDYEIPGILRRSETILSTRMLLNVNRVHEYPIAQLQ